MTTPRTASFSVPLGPAEIAKRLATVVAPDNAMVRWGGRTSQLPFVGTVGEASFAFRRPGRNSFKPLFLGHVRDANGATAVDIEARNIFSFRNPAVLFVTIAAIVVVGFSALTADGPESAARLTVIGTLLIAAFYVAIGRWQRAEIRRIFSLVERVAKAPTIDDARSIGLTLQ